jgi:insecticidal toxin complex protein TccC
MPASTGGDTGDIMSTALFSKTPTVIVTDNRGLPVRELQYYRHPDTPAVTAERITRHQYDERGFLTQSADPRLDAAGLANFTYRNDLTGAVIRTDSADAGASLILGDAEVRPFLTVTNAGTGEAVIRLWEYEDATLPGRLLSVTEQVAGDSARVAERFVYAGNSAEEKVLNLAGQRIRHYDTAGLMQTDSVALTGIPLSVTRRLLMDADTPDTVVDWQGQDASVWNDLLGAETHITLTTADATGAVLTTTDAKGNLQRVAYDVAGLLSGSWLTVRGGTEQVIVKSLMYSAAGQKLREEHGNGVVTTYTYEPETQRLTGIRTERPAGHAAGAKVLQDLRYAYDPVGNVLKISNDAEETRFWRNQKVVPENTYVYDSLYQLVSATGREMANAGQQGSGLPGVSSFGDATYTNYTRTYTYDSAGNLTQIRHSAPATDNNHTTNITVSSRSNRGVLSTLTENASEVDALFTAGGQQKQLQPGQGLVWTARNELRKVTPVVRDGGADDGEYYRYDADSQRVLKVSVQKTGSSVQTQRVMYLPGIELRTTSGGGTETESLQVITVGEAGRAQVRVLHWESGRPADITDGQTRYSYDNLEGSSQLELDGDGNIISMEEYYPYGGTAVWAARSAVEADYKTVRYSGKERDATGLYYYGYRYYQPWAGRWLSADPAGTVDGLNLFRMVRNNPATLYDDDGRTPGNRYIYFPLIHEDRILRLVRENTYRKTAGKSILKSVVAVEDIDRFKQAVDTYFSKETNVEIIQAKSQIKDDVLLNIAHSLIDLTPSDYLIINAHGHQGKGRFFPDQGYMNLWGKDAYIYAESARAEASKLVNKFQLNESTIVKVSTCHGSEGRNKAITIPFFIKDKKKMLDYVKEVRGDFSKSLAGMLEAELIKLQPGRTTGLVYGYLGETTFYGDYGKKISLTNNDVLAKGDYKGKKSIFYRNYYFDKGKEPIKFRRSLTRSNALGTS